MVGDSSSPFICEIHIVFHSSHQTILGISLIKNVQNLTLFWNMTKTETLHFFIFVAFHLSILLSIVYLFLKSALIGLLKSCLGTQWAKIREKVEKKKKISTLAIYSRGIIEINSQFFFIVFLFSSLI